MYGDFISQMMTSKTNGLSHGNSRDVSGFAFLRSDHSAYHHANEFLP